MKLIVSLKLKIVGFAIKKFYAKTWKIIKIIAHKEQSSAILVLSLINFVRKRVIIALIKW